MLRALSSHNIWSRNIFPFDMTGCVLYAPLWQEDMQGSSLLSYDKNHHVLTVSEATRSSTGRIFDGTDANIKITAATAFDVSAVTLMVWCKGAGVDGTQRPLARDSCYILQKLGTGDGGSNGIRFGVFWNNGANSQFTAESTISFQTNTTWHLVAVTCSGTAMVLYIDGVADKIATAASPMSSVTTRNVFVGAYGEDANALGEYWNGDIGEVIIYNRALTAAEVWQHYQITKGRYAS